VTTDEPPDQPEQQQAEHHIAQAKVPDHGVSADVARDDQAHNADSQQGMKYTGGQIPNALSEGGGCGHAKKMEM
jgi:hypothetical protein